MEFLTIDPRMLHISPPSVLHTVDPNALKRKREDSLMHPAITPPAERVYSPHVNLQPPQGLSVTPSEVTAGSPPNACKRPCLPGSTQPLTTPVFSKAKDDKFQTPTPSLKKPRRSKKITTKPDKIINAVTVSPVSKHVPQSATPRVEQPGKINASATIDVDAKLAQVKQLVQDRYLARQAALWEALVKPLTDIELDNLAVKYAQKEADAVAAAIPPLVVEPIPIDTIAVSLPDVTTTIPETSVDNVVLPSPPAEAEILPVHPPTPSPQNNTVTTPPDSAFPAARNVSATDRRFEPDGIFFRALQYWNKKHQACKGGIACLFPNDKLGGRCGPT